MALRRAISQASCPPSSNSSPTLLQRAVGQLARREHSRAELRRKLQRYLTVDSDAQDVERVLDQLAAQGMLSDARFMQSRLRVRAPRYGVARIKQELQQHGLAPELVREATQTLAGTEFERAWKIWQRKFGVVAQDQAQRAKQARFLAARGFDSEVVLRVLRQAERGF